MFLRCAIVALLVLGFAQVCYPLTCEQCHEKITPGIFKDWKLSAHSKEEVGCGACHGEAHSSAGDVSEVTIPTAETCAECHGDRVSEFGKGKHALAWAAMYAMPSVHWQPMALIKGKKGCGGCHRIGLKSDSDIEKLKIEGDRYGIASCDVCHTRHLFSVKEAQQPQTCQTCHMGIDHPQWEMYASSKHGIRYLLKQNGVLPANTAAPTCQSCHMKDGNHEVRTAWGFLAVRLPMPEDEQWAADRATILQALGVLDPEGKPTLRLDVVKGADVARFTQEDWEKERNKMIKTCSECHSSRYAKGELEKGDDMIREADHLMAEALRVVAALYKDGILKKAETYKHPFPDLLTFHDAPTPIEQKLHKMFLKHRMRTFQGAFHSNPDYAFWYGWSEMVQDLAAVKKEAEEMRASHKTRKR
jgi:hypothetical protein